MFKRFFRYLRALFMGKLDQWEDPEIIINEALREMKANQAKNRERAVQAITQKNRLMTMVDQEDKLARDLEAKATLALKQGNRELARELLREKGLHDGTLTELRNSLQQAEETSEAIKLALQRDEEQFRVKTAKALQLKANMKQAQIQIQINKALDGMQFDDTAQSWGRAEERIENMKAEASARAEVAKTSVSARLEQLSASQVDVEADRALEELEVKLGMGAPAAAPQVAPAAAAGEDDIDKQLQQLEQKLSQK